MTFLLCLSRNRQYILGKRGSKVQTKIYALKEKIRGRLQFIQFFEFELWDESTANPFFWNNFRIYEIVSRYSRITDEVDRWWQNDLFLTRKTEILWALGAFQGKEHESTAQVWYRNYAKITQLIENTIREITKEWYHVTNVDDKEEILQTFEESLNDFSGIPTDHKTCALLFTLLETLYYVISLPRK